MSSNPRTGTLAFLGSILDCDDLDATDTLLMVGIADHVDADDQTWVGIDELAARARCSYATAKRRLADLEDRGYITRERRRRSGSGNLSTYLTTIIRDKVLGLTVSHGKGSSGRALAMAHPDEPAEVPSSEPPKGPSRARRPVENPPGDAQDAWRAVQDYVATYGTHDPDRPRPPPWMADAVKAVGGMGAIRRDEVSWWDFRAAWVARSDAA